MHEVDQLDHFAARLLVASIEFRVDRFAAAHRGQTLLLSARTRS